MDIAELDRRTLQSKADVEVIFGELSFVKEKVTGIDRKVDRLEKQAISTALALKDIRATQHVMRARLDGHDKRFDEVDRRFDEVDRRFDEVDKRFDRIDARLDGMDQRFDGMDQRFDGMDQRFDGMDQRFDRMDAKLDGLGERMGRLIEVVLAGGVGAVRSTTEDPAD